MRRCVVRPMMPSSSAIPIAMVTGKNTVTCTKSTEIWSKLLKWVMFPSHCCAALFLAVMECMPSLLIKQIIWCCKAFGWFKLFFDSKSLDFIIFFSCAFFHGIRHFVYTVDFISICSLEFLFFIIFLLIIVLKIMYVTGCLLAYCSFVISIIICSCQNVFL